MSLALDVCKGMQIVCQLHQSGILVQPHLPNLTQLKKTGRNFSVNWNCYTVLFFSFDFFIAPLVCPLLFHHCFAYVFFGSRWFHHKGAIIR
jgi:hypothetical protein